jgi:lipoprotein NlpI
MRRPASRLAWVLAFLVGFGLAARAGPAELLKAGGEAVQGGQWDQAIRLYTQVIGAPGVTNSDLAVAHSNRGYAHFGKGEIDAAIADYSAAIRVAPNSADGHSLRGWANFTKGALSEAIADSSTAIRLDPRSAFAYRNRGRAHLYSGQAKPAADDFAAALRITPADPLGVLWLHIARVRSGMDDLAELKANMDRLDRKKWPGPLFEVLTGEKTMEAVGDIAVSEGGEKPRAERVCDAQVYFGLLQLAAGDRREAETLFKAAVEDCPIGVAEATEIAVARMELNRLGIGRASAEPKPVVPKPTRSKKSKSSSQ